MERDLMVAVGDVAVAHTPPGGYGEGDRPRYQRTMPPPVLAGCDQPPVTQAPDLRGTWRVVDVRADGLALPPEAELWAHTERIEQAGDRVVITSGGIVHDMVCDGTFEHGVHDVMALDFATPIVVAAAYEQGALVLRPQGMDGVAVTRRRDGDALVWDYAGAWRARLERLPTKT